MIKCGKTGLIVTITDIHFLPIRESCTHALPRSTKYLIIVGQVCFYRRCCQTTRVHFIALEGINRTAWGTRLLLTPVLASFVDWISLCHKLKAQHCSLSLSGCFNPPSASHPPPPPPHPPPTRPAPSRPPTPYRIYPWYYRHWKKLSKKPAAFK